MRGVRGTAVCVIASVLVGLGAPGSVGTEVVLPPVCRDISFARPPIHCTPLAFGLAILRVHGAQLPNGYRRIGRAVAANWVCLNNASKRPKKDVGFILQHSPFEGRFVPINEQMTFQAEMEALDLLDENERSMLSQMANEENKFDRSGDVTFGLRYSSPKAWSKRSAAARSRWGDPEYREKVIRKREQQGQHVSSVPSSAQAPPVAAHELPQLHSLLEHEMVSWSPEGGGWMGLGRSVRIPADSFSSGLRIGSISAATGTGGRFFDSNYTGLFGSSPARDRSSSRQLGASDVEEGARSEGMRRKITNLKLMHNDQNKWMAQRLGKDEDAPIKGTLEWRLEKQARYKEAASKRIASQRAQAGNDSP